MGGFQQRPWTPTKRRGPIAAEFSGPGPAAVALPSYIGKRTAESKSGRAPAFSFGARHNGKPENLGPGPGQYNVTGLSAKGKDTPPAVSLHGRHKEAKADNFPAPGDYDPDKAEKVIKDSAPRYTFGLKTNTEKPVDTPAPNEYNLLSSGDTPKYSFGGKAVPEKPLDTPAPNVYNIPQVVGDKKSSPSYTISGRNKDQVDDRIRVPGPGTYNYVDPEAYKQHSPAFSISARYNMPSDSGKKPGPGEYSPEKVHLDFIPAHSFGIKHSPYSEHY